MFHMDFTVTKAKWLSNPNLRWRAGLEGFNGVFGAGLEFRQGLQIQNYPPPPPMAWYVRTGTLAKKANFKVYEAGNTLTMFFGSTFYLPHLLWVAPNWSTKEPELLQAMRTGFVAGIQAYKED